MVKNGSLISSSVGLWLTVFATFSQTIAVSSANDLPDVLYVDDDINCQGFSPEQYQQRIRERQNLQRQVYQEYHLMMANQAAAEQRVFERIRMARRARFEKEARQREELIARRRAVGPLVSKSKPVATKSAILVDQ